MECEATPEPRLIVMVGMPASGKTTWAKEYLKKNATPILASMAGNEASIVIDNVWDQGTAQRLLDKICKTYEDAPHKARA